MAVYVKDKSSRSISIGPAIPATSPKENAATTPKNSGAATGAGDEFIYIPHIGQGYTYPPNLAWNVVVSGGTLAVLVVNLEVSDDDGVTWSTLDSSASVTGGRRVVANTLVKRTRANIVTFTVNSGTPVATVGITI